MTSIGFIEILIVLVLMLFSFDIKQIAQLFQWFRQMTNKFQQTKNSIQNELQQILLEPSEENLTNTKKDWRKWGKEQIQKIPQQSMLERVEAVIEHIEQEHHYQKSVRIGAFYGQLDEIETLLILQKILNDKKELYLPYCLENRMYFSKISDLHKDLEKGTFGIKEPKIHLQKDLIQPELLFIPGIVFDTHGGRIGRGKGFYDSYLDQHSTFKIGLCLDTQITDKKLSLSEHDQKMNMLISESQILQF